MQFEQMKSLVLSELDDMKAKDIVSIDMRDKSSVTDCLIVCTGTSSRHVKSCARSVVEKLKESDVMPLGVEGEDKSDWVLIDLGDIIVHVFQSETRQFYDIENLWQVESMQA